MVNMLFLIGNRKLMKDNNVFSLENKDEEFVNLKLKDLRN